MNEARIPHRSAGPAYLVAVIGAFLIMAWMTWLVVRQTHDEPVTKNRAAERAKNLAELNAANVELLHNYAWQDKNKDLVRLPIERAMQLTVQEWKDPKSARSNLVSRADKAAAPPPKVQYE